MAFDFFNARWNRIFADAGLPVKKEETIYFPRVDRKYESTTRAIVGFDKQNVSFNGTRPVQCNHLSLSKLLKNLETVEAYVYVPRSTIEVARALISRYGLPLQPEWFVNRPITDEQMATTPFEITLQLRSVNWCVHSYPTDDITVTVYEPNMDVKDVFEKKVLDVLTLPYTVKSGATNVELLSVGVDFTPLYVEDYGYLLQITTSEDLYLTSTPYVYRSEVLTRLMQERTGIVTKRDADWSKNVLSTYHAKFVYNGLTTEYPNSDTRYDRVLVFDINAYAKGFSGRYYFHYNDLY